MVLQSVVVLPFSSVCSISVPHSILFLFLGLSECLSRPFSFSLSIIYMSYLVYSVFWILSSSLCPFVGLVCCCLVYIIFLVYISLFIPLCFLLTIGLLLCCACCTFLFNFQFPPFFIFPQYCMYWTPSSQLSLLLDQRCTDSSLLSACSLQPILAFLTRLCKLYYHTKYIVTNTRC